MIKKRLDRSLTGNLTSTFSWRLQKLQSCIHYSQISQRKSLWPSQSKTIVMLRLSNSTKMIWGELSFTVWYYLEAVVISSSLSNRWRELIFTWSLSFLKMSYWKLPLKSILSQKEAAKFNSNSMKNSISTGLILTTTLFLSPYLKFRKLFNLFTKKRRCLMKSWETI